MRLNSVKRIFLMAVGEWVGRSLREIIRDMLFAKEML
jgi:hypothetical protein